MNHVNRATAQQILNQLGGNKFIVMTGAQIAFAETALMIKLPSNSAKDRINRVEIILNAWDLYDIIFYNCRSAMNIKIVYRLDDISSDNLANVFSQRTGLSVRL